MISSNTRFRVVLCIVVAVVSLLACGDSDDTPLGSEFVGDILGSTPGEVYEDSFSVSNDTSYAFYSMIDQQIFFEVGLDEDYMRTSLLTPDFSSAGGDTLRTVTQAILRLTKIENVKYADEITARFYGLGTLYAEGDSVETLDTAYVIPDTSGAVDRELQLFPREYALPPDLVQGWIRGDIPNNGMAIVYTGVSDEFAGFWSRTGQDPPTIEVVFSDLEQSSYRISDDGIYVRPTTTTDNLVISDGFVRRLHFYIDLSQVDDSSAVHQAEVVFNIVPGTVFGASQTVVLYVPASPDPNDPGFLEEERRITTQTLDSASGVLVLPLTNILLLVLSGEVQENGFVLRFSSENTEVRQAEFYTSSHSTLPPEVFMIYSTPADFEE
jgi:hypothetical protein